jgi:hypothetical protein
MPSGVLSDWSRIADRDARAEIRAAASLASMR